MQRNFDIKGVLFEICNHTPRNNEYEKGLKYKLFVDGFPTSYCFDTIRNAKDFATKNYFIWL